MNDLEKNELQKAEAAIRAPRRIKPSRRQLSPEEKQLKETLRGFTSSKASALIHSCVVDATKQLQAVRSVLKTVDLNLAVANKVNFAVSKRLTKSPIPQAPFSLTKDTVDAALATFEDIIAKLSGVREASTKQKENLSKLSKRIFNTAAEIGGLCQDDTVWISVLRFSHLAARASNSNLGEFVPPGIGDLPSSLEKNVLRLLAAAIERGNGDTAESVILLTRSHKLMYQNVLLQLQSAVTKMGTLPRPSQLLLTKHLSLRDIGPQLEYSSPGERPELRQAATLLLFLYDHRNDSAVADEAFQRYQAICGQDFKLYLRGKVGEEVGLDTRLHETPDVRAEKFKLLRPWIEWYSPPEARVVVRGIVEPA